MDSEMVQQCIGPLSTNYLSKCLHHVFPCPNLNKVMPSEHFNGASSVCSPIFKPSPLSSSVPVPFTCLYKLNREVNNGIDPTTILIRDKIKWQMKKDRILKAVQKDKNSIRKKLIHKAKKVPVGGEAMIPQGVALLAQHLDTDPDPFFSGACNWYYTGGTLGNIRHDEQCFLLQANHSDLCCSRIMEGCQPELSSTLPLKDGGPIFQIVTSNTNGVAVRQKSRVSFISWEDSKDNQLRENYNVFDKRHSFVSIALPSTSQGTFCTISNARVLKLWDIEYKKCKMKLQVGSEDQVSTTDNWSTMHYLDPRTLLLADRCCLHVFDTRTKMEKRELAWCPKTLMELCEEQCNLLPSSVSDNCVYVATTHQLFCLDLRRGYTQRWTHMMTSTPHLGFTHHMDHDLELVCLGSQVLSDCTAIVNTWTDNQGQSLYKPTSLYSPAQGLHLARRHGHCLDPSFTQRCTQSTIGLTFLPAENGIRVVRQSATADVFVQDLSMSAAVTRPKQLNERELNAYCQWSKPMLTLLRDNALSTTVTCTYDYHSIFTEESKHLLEKDAKVVKDKISPLMYSSCHMSKQYMENCVDLLAGKLLSVWQVEEEDEWIQQLEEEEISVQDPEEKVINWLHATDTVQDKMLPSKNSTITPGVESTPNAPKGCRKTSPKSSENASEPSPWMTQPSQVLRLTPTEPQEDPYFSQGMMFSPNPSMSSSASQRKIRKLFNSPVTKAVVPQKKSDSVQKKKFVPGF